MKDSQSFGIMVIVLICVGVVTLFFVLTAISEDREFLESATCEQIMELIRNSDYGVEYNNKWIENECWKQQIKQNLTHNNSF